MTAFCTNSLNNAFQIIPFRFRGYANGVERNDRTRLFQITTSLDPKLGGPTSVVLATLKYLDHIFDHKLIIFGKSLPSVSRQVSIPTFMNNRYGFTFKRLKFLGLHENRDTDIVLIHGFYLYSTLISLLFFKSGNIYLMPHGSLEEYQERVGKFRKYIFRLCLGLVLRNREIHFLLGSHPERKSVLKLFPNAKISVVGLGISLEDMPLARVKTLNRPIKLFCMSRISGKKRIDLCVRAVEKLNILENRYSLEIIGSGELKLENELRKLVAQLNLEQVVKFSGFLEGREKSSAISASDILLLPSENENFAVAVAESIAAGKPVVVSKYVAMHEFVDRYKTGITLDSLQVDDLVKAIEMVSENYTQFQKNCIDSLHKLSWEEVHKNWIRALTNWI